MLLVATGYAVGPLIASRKLSDLPGLGMTAVCLAFAAVVYAPAAALTLPHALPPARVIASLAVLAVICTAAAFLLFLMLIAEIGPARAMVFTYVNPAVAVALGVAVLGEPLTPVIVLSFALILSGSVLAARAGKAAAPASPDAAAAAAAAAAPDALDALDASASRVAQNGPAGRVSSATSAGPGATAAVLPGEPVRRP